MVATTAFETKISTRHIAQHNEANIAEISNVTDCKVESFVDRDVDLLRCLDDQPCQYKRRFGRTHICGCPDKR